MPKWRNSTTIMLEIVEEFGGDRKKELMRELKHFKRQAREEIVGRLRRNIKKFLENL